MKQHMRIYAEPDSDSQAGFRHQLVNMRMKFWVPDSWIHLHEVEVEFQVPEFSPDDFRRLAIKTLKEKQDQARAEAEKEVMRYQSEIDDLLLLTDQSQDDGSVVSTQEPDMPF